MKLYKTPLKSHWNPTEISLKPAKSQTKLPLNLTSSHEIPPFFHRTTPSSWNSPSSRPSSMPPAWPGRATPKHSRRRLFGTQDVWYRWINMMDFPIKTLPNELSKWNFRKHKKCKICFGQFPVIYQYDFPWFVFFRSKGFLTCMYCRRMILQVWRLPGWGLWTMTDAYCPSLFMSLSETQTSVLGHGPGSQVKSRHLG